MATFLNTLNESEQAEIKKAILAVYPNLGMDGLNAMINALEVGGVQFAAIKGYQSEISNGTETADALINIGAAYENMKKKDINIYENFDVNTVNVDNFNYQTIDTGGISLEKYKEAVNAALPIALAELIESAKKPKTRDTSSDIYLTRVLIFNTNTQKLALFGQRINKTVIQEGTFKVVKSAPKTIAKKLIEKAAKGRTATLGRFVVDNMQRAKINNGELVFE